MNQEASGSAPVERVVGRRGRPKKEQPTEHRCGPERLGRRLRKAREMNGVSSEALAEAMQISTQELGDREYGKAGMCTMQITRACRYMQIQIPDFFDSPIYD